MIEAPVAGIRGTKARTQWVTLSKFSSTRASWPLRLTPRNSLLNVPPTLLTKTSTRPKRCRTAKANSPTAPPSLTSNRPVRADRPVASTSAAAAARFSESRSHMATSAPKRAKATAMARPMPTAAPVTTATRSVNRTLLGPRGSPEDIDVNVSSRLFPGVRATAGDDRFLDAPDHPGEGTDRLVAVEVPVDHQTLVGAKAPQ